MSSPATAPKRTADGRVDVVVFLNANWATLERRSTRWSEVLRRWSLRSDIGQLHVVDHPKYRRRPGALIRAMPSWCPRIQSWEVRLPLPPGRRTPMDAAVLSLAGRRVGHRLALRDAVAVAASPAWVPLVSRLAGVDRWGFDAVDDWRALGSASRLLARTEQGELAAAAATVRTAVSSDLARTIGERSGAAVVAVTNGVDPTRFEPPFDDLPHEVARMLPSGPFSVYVGSVEHRVDLTLVAAVVESGTPVVIAGPIDDDLIDTATRTGATLLGPVERADLPGLLARASVGLVPHRDTPLTRSMDPMKTLEYLASGLPVVATRVADRPEHRDRVKVADEPAGFVAAVRSSISDHRRLPTAPLRTWDQVSSELWAAHVSPSGRLP